MDPSIKGFYLEKHQGQLRICARDGSVVYIGGHSSEEIEEALKDAPGPLRWGILRWVDLALGRDRFHWKMMRRGMRIEAVVPAYPQRGRFRGPSLRV